MQAGAMPTRMAPSHLTPGYLARKLGDREKHGKCWGHSPKGYTHRMCQGPWRGCPCGLKRAILPCGWRLYHPNRQAGSQMSRLAWEKQALGQGMVFSTHTQIFLTYYTTNKTKPKPDFKPLNLDGDTKLGRNASIITPPEIKSKAPYWKRVYFLKYLYSPMCYKQSGEWRIKEN